MVLALDQLVELLGQLWLLEAAQGRDCEVMFGAVGVAAGLAVSDAEIPLPAR